MENKIDVLYVHPGRHASDYNIPVGLIGLMNSIDCTKIGKMYYEITDGIILKSKIIVMDCHWYFSLSEIERLSSIFKKIKKDIIIIIGGHTATIFAKYIIDRFKVDFVIKGDAEIPFPLLIKELLGGRNGRHVPNIVNKKFVTPQSYSLTSKDFSDCDYINIDWFPLLELRMKKVHRLIEFGCNEQLGIYPLIPIYKGCKYNCEFCYTKQTSHIRLYKRGFILRTAESIIKDLLLCSHHKYIRQVYMVADFINLTKESFYKKILSQKYNVNLYYEFEHFNSPDLPILTKMISCFRKCYFAFVFGEPFNNNPKIRFNYLSKVLDYFESLNKEIGVKIYYGGSNRTMRYCRELQLRHKELTLSSYKQWFRPVPFICKNNNINKISYFSFWKKKANKDSAFYFLAQSLKDGEYRFQLLMGKLCLDQKKYHRAVHYIRKALNLNPHKSIAHFYLAKAYFGLNQYREAIRNVKKADYKEIDIRFFLGSCYEKIKQFNKAIKEYREAENIDKKNPKINLSLFNCYTSINRKKQANKELEKLNNKIRNIKDI